MPSLPPAARANPRRPSPAWPTARTARSRFAPGDTIVLASTPIPGNEEEVARLINKLIRRGANLLYPPLANVHVSGHASQEEQKLMLALTKPQYFVPVHGELRHLHAHARIAEDMGVPRENIFVIENGAILEITEESAQVVGQVASANVFVDGTVVGDVGPTRHGRARGVVA